MCCAVRTAISRAAGQLSLTFMRELSAVDGEAYRALSSAASHVRRQERATPLLEEFRGNIEAAQSVALPARTLNKACH
jgi:hypothetical protein